MQVPGRLYPISVEDHPIPCVEDSDRINPAPYVRILQVNRRSAVRVCLKMLRWDVRRMREGSAVYVTLLELEGLPL